MSMIEAFLLTPWMGFLKAVRGKEWMSRDVGLLFLCRVFYLPLEAISFVKMTSTLLHSLPIPSKPNISHLIPFGLKSKWFDIAYIQSFYCIHMPGWQMGKIIRDTNQATCLYCGVTDTGSPLTGEARESWWFLGWELSLIQELGYLWFLTLG